MNASLNIWGFSKLRCSGLGVRAMVGILASLMVAGTSTAEQLPVSFANSMDAISTVHRIVMPIVDVAALKAEDQENDRALIPGPTRFAAPIEGVHSLENSGTWVDLDDGSHVWRLRIYSQGALSLNLGLTTFDLPEGARLWVYDTDGEQIAGPYSQQHRSADGQLWLPVILADEIVLELHTPANARDPQLVVGSVNHGYRFFGEVDIKQGACNIDVVCPEVDPYRDQVRAVARYTRSGIFLCTGNLVNNTAVDYRPFFLTAEHCGITTGNASSVVVYWNYESPSCGQLSGGSLADNQTGASFLASSFPSDFALVELNQMPDPSSNVFYAGWDAGGTVPQSVVGIHHPGGDEKAAAFEGDALSSVDVGRGGETHWEVSAWDLGTTEGGSSGSCIFDQTSKNCVGHLTGGFASCSDPTGFDIYGKLSVAWTGDGSDSTRLSNWLDPVNGGTTQVLPGTNPGGTGEECVEDSDTLCLNGGRFKVEVVWTTSTSEGPGIVVPGGTDDSSNMYFFSSNNWEMLIKVLDGCGFNDRYWVFFAATTDVGFTVTVTDTANDLTTEYTNALGQPANAVTDTDAFATCP